VYPSLSTIGLLHTIGPERVPHGQNVLAAYDREQTRIAYEEASGIVCADKRIVEATRTLDYRHSIIHLKAVSSDAAAQNGRTPNFVLFDEVHAWRDRKLYDVLRTGLGKTSGTLSIVISQAGRGQENPAHEIFDYAGKVASGAIEDAGTLPILFETPADPYWQEKRYGTASTPALRWDIPISTRYGKRLGRQQTARRFAITPSPAPMVTHPTGSHWTGSFSHRAPAIVWSSRSPELNLVRFRASEIMIRRGLRLARSPTSARKHLRLKRSRNCAPASARTFGPGS
jgi:hypothetical protein